MPSMFLRRFASFCLILCASVAAHGASCVGLLIPDLAYPHNNETFDLAYLAVINAENFGAHKKNSELARGPTEHPETFSPDNPVGLSLPIAKALLTSSENFEEFSAKRAQAYAQHQFNYPPADLATAFRRSLPSRRVELYEKCTNATGFNARIARADREIVELSISWRAPADATASTSVSKVVVTGGTLASVVPTTLKAPTTLLFIRDLDKDFRFSATIGGAPATVFVPRHIAAKAVAAATGGQCAGAAAAVRGVYKQMLDRDATPAEVASLSAAIAGGRHDILQLVEFVVASAEYDKKFVAGKSPEDTLRQLYRRVLGREGDDAGILYNTRLLHSNGFLRVATGFVQSREYRQRFGDWSVPGAPPKIKYCATK